MGPAVDLDVSLSERFACSTCPPRRSIHDKPVGSLRSEMANGVAADMTGLGGFQPPVSEHPTNAAFNAKAVVAVTIR